MADPNLRCQVAALPSIPDGTCISDVATDTADVMLSTAAELAPRSNRPRGAQGWRAGPGLETERSAAWQQRDKARKRPRAEPHKSNLRKVVKMANKNLRNNYKAAVLSLFWDFVRKLETRNREGDQAGFYKHLKAMNLERKQNRSSAYIKDENGILLRDGGSYQRTMGLAVTHSPQHAKSPRLYPKITKGLDLWPENMPLGV